MSFSSVCVYAGSAPGTEPAYEQAARSLAAVLVASGTRIVYGGGSVGLMGTLADAALAAGGEVVGVIPRFLEQREVGHDGLTDLRIVDNMHERKMLMAELADAFVVLPGGIGTLEEVVEMLSWSQLGLHRKPIGLLDAGGFWNPLVHLLDHMTAHRFIASDHRRLLLADHDPNRLMNAMSDWKAPTVARWLERGDET